MASEQPQRPITDEDLRRVKAGLQKLKDDFIDLTLRQYARLIQRTQELAKEVGGMDQLKRCLESLAGLLEAEE
jgi:hypothetical protein